LKPKQLGLCAIILSSLLASSAMAQKANPGDTAYNCERNGSKFWSERPCEEINATEIGRGKFADPNAPKPSYESMRNTAPEPEQEPENADGDNAAQASELTEEQKDDILAQGRKSLLRLLAFAVVFGALAKLTGRSFLRWFLVGGALHFVLVALDVLPH